MKIAHRVSSLIACSSALALFISTLATAGDDDTSRTELISVRHHVSDRRSADAESSQATLSADGRYVVFVSTANDLVPNDNNNVQDVFVYDRLTTQIDRVSVNSEGVQTDRLAGGSAISGDGRYVAFYSNATNLVPSDSGAMQDLFLRDRRNGTTQRISETLTGKEANSSSDDATISADGRFIAFATFATNLVPGDNVAYQDILVYDRVTRAMVRATVDPQGASANGDSAEPRLSADGHFVAFSSHANNIAANCGDLTPVPETTNVYVRDLRTGVTTCESVDPAGGRANGRSDKPSLSADGRFIAFRTNASNLVGGDTNDLSDVIVRDRQTGISRRVSLRPDDTQLTQFGSVDPMLSLNGRFVTFTSGAPDLVPGDTNDAADIFVRDLQSGTTIRVSASSSGQAGNADSLSPTISYDGSIVAFLSLASNLTPFDTNARADTFVREISSGRTRLASLSKLPSRTADGFSEMGGKQSLSLTGRFVAFSSRARNLVARDENGVSDVFVRDRLLKTTERVSVDAAGGEANGDSRGPAISIDGRFVAFTTLADNLTHADVNDVGDVVLRDRFTRTNVLVSIGMNGAPAGGSEPSISAFGRYVAFTSSASNLVPGDTNGIDDVFVYDRVTRRVSRVSVTSEGAEALELNHLGSTNSAISADGRFVVFSSFAYNLAPPDGGRQRLFVHDRWTRKTRLVSVSPEPNLILRMNYAATVSADGRYIAFASGTDTDIPGFPSFFTRDDLYLRDMTQPAALRINNLPNGDGNFSAVAVNPSISADGRYVAFVENASLVPEDENFSDDLYVLDRVTHQYRFIPLRGGSPLTTGVAAISGDGAVAAYMSFNPDIVAQDFNGTGDIFVNDAHRHRAHPGAR